MSNYPCESNHIVVTKKSKVPEYLQQGDFYKSLNDEGDEEISVPSNTLKPNTIVESTEDLQDLLSSLRFWAVDSVMEEVVEYCLIKNSTTCATVLEVFMNDFCYVKTIVQMLPLTEEDRAKLAIKLGLLEFVIVLHKSCCALPDGCHIAARAGHLHVLQYLHEHGGKIDTLIELICEGSEWPPSSLCVCSHAAAEGSIECLRYVREQGCCEWRDNSSLPLIPAIWKGQTSCVEYALQHGYPISQEYDIYCYVAARMGFIYILKLLHAAGSPFNEHTCSEAAYNGHLDCVQYLHENGCPWYKCICEEAARGGSVDCLRYAHENGCDWDALTCTEAAKNGKLQCLQYAHEHGCDWNVSTCTEAARYGHLECLQYAHEHGCEWNAKTCNEAARHGHLLCLKYAHENGCPWSASTCTETVRHGHITCLQYAHEHGALWDESTFRIALANRQLKCLKYLVENGCPVDQRACRAAVEDSKNAQCVEYLKTVAPHLFQTWM